MLLEKKLPIFILVLIGIAIFSINMHTVAVSNGFSTKNQIKYLHLYVVNGGNITQLGIKNVSINFSLHAYNYSLLYNISKNDYDLRVYKTYVTLEINNTEIENVSSYILLYFESHKDYNVTISIGVINTTEGPVTVMYAFLSPKEDNLNMGDVVFINTSSYVTLNNQLLKYSKYIHEIGRYYLHSSNKSIKLLGHYYIKIAKAVRDLEKTINNSWISKIKSTYLISAVADNTLSCAFAILGAIGTAAGVVAATIEAAPIGFIIASYFLPVAIADAGYECFGG